MRFVEWVREKRKTMKYHEIAAELNVHPSYLGHIKNGKFTISKKFAEKVEEASGGLCKKEEIVFEVVDPKESWGDDDLVEEKRACQGDARAKHCSTAEAQDIHDQDPIERLRHYLC